MFGHKSFKLGVLCGVLVIPSTQAAVTMSFMETSEGVTISAQGYFDLHSHTRDDTVGYFQDTVDGLRRPASARVSNLEGGLAARYDYGDHLERQKENWGGMEIVYETHYTDHGSLIPFSTLSSEWSSPYEGVTVSFTTGVTSDVLGYYITHSANHQVGFFTFIVERDEDDQPEQGLHNVDLTISIDGVSFVDLGLDHHRQGITQLYATPTDFHYADFDGVDEDLNFYVRFDSTVVPEPSTTALLGFGGVALLLRRKRK